MSLHHLKAITFFLLLAISSHVSSQSLRRKSRTTSQSSHSTTNDDESSSSSSSALTTSSIIPSVDDTIELGHLSAMVYGFRSTHSAQNCSSFPAIYQLYVDEYQPSTFINSNATYTCHMYERDEQDTQVLVLSKQIDPSSYASATNTNNAITTATNKEKQGYVAVIYAGTDDFRSVLTDTNILTKTFGPTSENGTHPFVPHDDIRVHAGFNNAVFKHDLFKRINHQLQLIKGDNPNYRLLTTGHSLGAADAILTAVALKLQDEWKDELVLSINYGCPKTGNRAWRDFVNEMDGLGIWRVVNGLDLAARLPGPSFHHVGHTLQMDGNMARAFWLHAGDKKLGFRGVSFAWNTLPYAFAPVAAYEHLISHYIRYLEERCAKDPDIFYVDSFETIDDGGHSDDSIPDAVDDDDAWMPDDLIDIDIEYTKQYLHLVRQEASDKLYQSLDATVIADA